MSDSSVNLRETYNLNDSGDFKRQEDYDHAVKTGRIDSEGYDDYGNRYDSEGYRVRDTGRDRSESNSGSDSGK